MSQIDLVVANGSDTFGLGGRTADHLTDIGYASVVNTDALRETSRTRIYFADGFDTEARELADLLGAQSTNVVPAPSFSLTVNAVSFDVLIMLGNDWEDATNLEF